MIDEREVEHVARLARLRLTNAEQARMRAQLARILTYIDQLRALDVEGVEPTSHAVPMVNVMREDELEACPSREAMMANAPEPAGDLFRVPRIIED